MPRTRVLAMLPLALLAACSAARLQPAETDDGPMFDNRLDVRGDFCTQAGDDIHFPVKVLLVVDQSTSLQCTDANNRRFEALNAMVDQIRAQQDTSIGAIGFSSWAREVDFGGDLAMVLDPSGGLGTATDYQGALAQTLKILERDMVNSGPAERARTRYIVIFVSDGSPEPKCLAGCEDDMDVCSDGEDNDGDDALDGADTDCANISDQILHPDNRYGICNAIDARMALEEEGRGDEYADFDGLCPAYNTPEQILGRVGDILALADTYGVGSVTFNTVLLFSPMQVLEAICGPQAQTFGYTSEQARPLMRAMARAGEGTFRDVNIDASNDAFFEFHFEPLQTPQILNGFVAFNEHARVGADDWVLDQDTDGLDDESEHAAMTSVTERDTDMDGYSDLFEQRMASRGFAPNDPAAPAIPCAGADAQDDPDRDRLRDCEEIVLETDSRHPDTDGDGLSDWIELVSQTNPLVNEGMTDLDFDGALTREEVAGGTDPNRPDGERFRNDRVQYTLTDIGTRNIDNRDSGETETRQCYEWGASNLRLVSTPIPGLDRGLNRILVYAHEQQAQVAGAPSITHVACFEAFYRGSSFKLPESGIIDLRQSAWDALAGRITQSTTMLGQCSWFGTSAPGRSDIVDTVVRCLPDAVRIGRFEHPRDELVSLIRKYIAPDGSSGLPEPASEMFVPIENFQPDRDCVRPWEVDRVLDLFTGMRAACGACAARMSSPDGGVVSTCCM